MNRWKKLILVITLAGLLSISTAVFSAGAAAVKIGKQPTDAVVYVGDSVQLSVSASGGYKLSYQWFTNISNNTSNGTRISGATGPTYAPPTSKTGTIYYYCKVFSTGSPSSVQTVCSDTATVTVKAPLQITAQPTGLTVNSGDTASLTLQAKGSGTLTYQWYSNTVNKTADAVKIPDGVGASCAVPTDTAGVTYYFCIVTNKDTAITSTPTTTVTSSIVKVTVKAVSTTVPVMVTQPSSKTVYAGTPAQLSVSAAAKGTLSYQWYSSPSDTATDATAISGATSSSYSVPTTAVGCVYYYCVVTNTPPTGTETYKTSSSIVSCTVKPVTAITDQPQGQTALLGDTVTLRAAATGSATLSYQWYVNTKNSTTGGSAIANATGPSYTVPTTGTGSAYFYCVVTNTDPAVTAEVKTSTAVTDVVEVAILAESATPPTITATPAGAVVYAGTSKQLSVKAEGAGELTYQWYSAATAATDNGTAVSGAVTPTLTVPNATPGTVFYYCVVTNTVDTASGPQSMTASTAAVSMGVLPLPVITSQPGDATVCTGSAATLTVGASGSGTLSYQWYAAKDSKATGSRIIGATGPSYTFNAGSLGAVYYYCVVTNTDSSVTENVKTAAVTSSRARVTVVSADAAPPSITKQPVNATVVSSVPATLSVTASGSGTLSYQWYANTKQSVKGALPIPGATSSTYNPPTDKAGKTYYYCAVTNTDTSKTGTAARSALTNIVYVLVSAKEPTISRQPTAAKLYAGTAYSLSVKASGTGTLSYQWYTAGSDASVSGATGPTLQVPSSALGTVSYYCVVTNTVTTASGVVTGTAASAAARIDIVAYPVITAQPAGLTVNSGESFTLSAAATGTGTASYQWYAASSPGAAGNPVKKATSASLKVDTKASSETKTAYYYCVITFYDKTMTATPRATLKSSAVAVTIKAVNAAPPVIVTKPVSQALKVGDSAVLTVSATGSGTLTYQWYSNTRNSTSKGVPIAGATGDTLQIPTAKSSTVFYYCVITNTDNSMAGTKTAAIATSVVKIVVRNS
jgi:hypothetical protein